MNLLLDAHALLWALADPGRLLEGVRQKIEDPDNSVHISTATAWEIAIKVGLGKLPVPGDLQDWLPAALSASHFLHLPVTLEHALGVERLPLHHRDPFDRLLITQAVVEGMTIVTRDRAFEPYGVQLLRC